MTVSRWFVKKTHLTGIPKFERGWGNGYVILPPGHPYHGCHYDQIPVDVHGGLTFCGRITDKGQIETTGWKKDDLHIMEWKEVTIEDAGGWIVGFDTAHHGDSVMRWPKMAVEREAQGLKAAMDDLATALAVAKPDESSPGKEDPNDGAPGTDGYSSMRD